MTTDYADSQTMQITDEEVAALAEQLKNTNPSILDDLKSKNSAVVTVTMTPVMRVLIDEACKNSDGTPGSAADWMRQLAANAIGYELPVKEARVSKTDKRGQAVKAKAERSLVAQMIEDARAGKIEL